MSRSAHDEARTLLLQLADQGGLRPPSSPAEATVAAYLNARLRRSGMRVDTRELRVVSYLGSGRIIPALLALLAALSLFWFPLPALLLGLLALLLALADSLLVPLPALLPRQASQVIIANRAVEPRDSTLPAVPRRRVLLLAPLDTPAQPLGLGALLGPQRAATLGRLALLAVAVAAAALTLWLPFLAPAAALLAALAQLPILLAARRQRRFSAPYDGGIGALAAMIAAGQRLGGLQHVEVWAIGIGAAYADPAGVELLARRFPFTPAETLVIALQRLDQGQLAYTTRTGALRPMPGSDQLLHLAATADASDSLIDAEPRPYYADDALAAPLQRMGIPALHILSLPDGEPHSVAPPADPLLVERAARLIVAMVRRLDALLDHDTPS